MFHSQPHPEVEGVPNSGSKAEPSVGSNGLLDYICML
jgi:hypothetical protein